jgi:glycosyltransferase involved in cell wall biosynthesis
MRILVFGNLTPYVPGGAERQVRLLVEGWARLGHEVTVVGTRLPETELDVDGYTVSLYRAPVAGVAGRAGRAVSYFVSICRTIYRMRGRYDLIYCRFLTDSACSVAFLKHLKLVNRPLVACPASSGPGGDAEFLRGFPFTKFLTSILSAHCDVINLISPGIEDEIRKLEIRPARWSHIHNGVMQASVPENMPGNETLRLVFVGGLRRQKGVDILLESVNKACRKGVRLTLDLIGDGPDRGQLEQQAGYLQLDAVTRFHGILGTNEVAEYMQNSHILVLPSRWEGMANVALEALALGRPVIASRCGGIDRFIEPACGWTVDIDDHEALTASIVAAARLSMHDLQVMGQAAYDLVNEQFSMDLAVTMHLDLFSSVLGKPGCE